MSDIKENTTQEQLVWKTADGREIPISELDNDHLIKCLHRETGKKEIHEKRREEYRKKLEKHQQNFKKHDDLTKFHTKMVDALYEELKERHLVMNYFLTYNTGNISITGGSKDKDNNSAAAGHNIAK